jgi:hypothetical protein
MCRSTIWQLTANSNVLNTLFTARQQIPPFFMTFECSVASEQECDDDRRIHTTPPYMKLVVVTSFETVVPIHQTTQFHFPEQSMTLIFTVIKNFTSQQVICWPEVWEKWASRVS